MFHNVLLATDGSPHADRAAERALYMAKNLPDMQLTIMHVTSEIPPSSKLMEVNFDVMSLLEEGAHQAIMKTEKEFEVAGIPYKLEVAWGDPAFEIMDHAERGGYDLIIIGSRGLGRLGEMFLGSVSQKVLHEAKCPVLIVK